MSPKDATKPRATIRTVAADAGVSVAAVSKVLRGAYGVSDALRAKVNTSIEKLNYRPSKAAQQLRGQSTTVGILLVEIANPYLPGVIDGLHDVLDPSHYQALIGIGKARATLETDLIESMIDHGMAGVVLVAPMLPLAVVQRYTQRLPMVLVAYHEEPSSGFDTVNCDDVMGGAMAARALIAAGHRDLAFIANREGAETSVNVSTERARGFVAEAARAGLVARTFRLNSRQGEREPEMAAILSAPDRPHAVGVWSDIDAIPLLGVAQRLGLRVPQDLAVVGYDDSPMAGSPLIGLTSINQNGRKQGRMAARALLERIAGRTEAKHLTVVPELRVRHSLQATSSDATSR